MIARGLVRVTGVLAALALAAPAVSAAHYELREDGAGGVLRLDTASGAVERCTTVERSGPKVVDVFGFETETRPGLARAPVTECVTALAPPADPPAWWPGVAARDPLAGADVYLWWGPLPGRPLDSRQSYFALQPKVVRLPID